MDIKRILLTGGSGLVGRTLTPLLKDSYDVTHFDTCDPGDGLPFIHGDLRDSRAVADACTGQDAVLHVAALHGNAWAAAGDDTGFEVNVMGLKNVLEGAAKAEVKRVVFTSSIWATGHDDPPPQYLPIDEKLQREPAELYGLTKLLGEQMCRYASAVHGSSVIVLRPGGIRPAGAYAPLQPGYLFGAVDVRDVAQAQVLALKAPAGMCFQAFVITADSPLCRASPEAYFADPAGTLDVLMPGVLEATEAGRLTLPGRPEWYTIAKAKQMLGYAPKYNFTL